MEQFRPEPDWQIEAAAIEVGSGGEARLMLVPVLGLWPAEGAWTVEALAFIEARPSGIAWHPLRPESWARQAPPELPTLPSSLARLTESELSELSRAVIGIESSQDARSVTRMTHYRVHLREGEPPRREQDLGEVLPSDGA